VVLLGYRDSGMPGTPANEDPRSFAAAPLEEAVGRLVAVVRRTRPQVVVTYPQNQEGYPHPDHLRVNEISELAFDAAGDPDRFLEAGPTWQPLRLYYVQWSVKRMVAMHEKFLELGLESPYKDERMQRMLEALAGSAADNEGRRLHVTVDIRGFNSVMRESLLAHATQVDPTSRHWFGLPTEVSDELYPYDEYEVARDLTGVDAPGGDRCDLFAGLDVVHAV
jgi:mycothiol S-conjugate amidase